MLTQRKRPLAAPRSVEVQLPALRPGVRIQGWSRNRWGRCRWRAKRAIYGAGIHSGSNIWRGRGNTLALMPTNPPSHRAMNKHMSPTIPDICCGQCCVKNSVRPPNVRGRCKEMWLHLKIDKYEVCLFVFLSFCLFVIFQPEHM